MGFLSGKIKLGLAGGVICMVIIMAPGCTVLKLKKVDDETKVTEIQDKRAGKVLHKQRRCEDKDFAKRYQKMVKNHMKLQTRETRTRMKQNARQSKRINKTRKQSFMDRLFHPGCP